MITRRARLATIALATGSASASDGTAPELVAHVIRFVGLIMVGVAARRKKRVEA